MPTPEELAMMQMMQAQQQPQVVFDPIQQYQPQPQPMPAPMPQAPMPPQGQQPMPAYQPPMQEYWQQQQQLGQQEPPGLAPMAYPSGNMGVGGLDPSMVMESIRQGPQVGMTVNPTTMQALVPNMNLSYNLNNPQEQGLAVDYMRGREAQRPPSGAEISDALLALGMREGEGGQPAPESAKPKKRKSSPDEKKKRLALAKKAREKTATKNPKASKAAASK